MLFTVATADMVQALGRPFAKQEDQQRAAKAADDFGEGHRVKHGGALSV